MKSLTPAHPQNLTFSDYRPGPRVLYALAVMLCRILFILTVSRAAAAPGDLDPLNPPVVGTMVYATAVQPDGKIIVAGSFTSVSGVARRNMVRLNTDGSLDTGFDPSPDGAVYCLAVQPDGKVVIGGSFSSLRPNGGGNISRKCLVRVNSSGGVDESFNPDVVAFSPAGTTVYGIALHPDGRIVVGGGFARIAGPGGTSSGPYLARLAASGEVDTGFDPRPDAPVLCLALQSDGKLLTGGQFTAFSPSGGAAVTRNYFARINPEDTVDTSFDPAPNRQVYCLAIEADGRVLLGGSFTTLRPNGAATETARDRIARVTITGTLDTGFNPKANGDVWCLAVQTDGRVLVGGGFTALQPNGAAAVTTRSRLARVNADGTLDTGFNPAANDVVRALALQADGKVVAGGAFTALQPNGAAFPTTRNRLARLQNDTATRSLTIPGTGHAQWLRGGASPEAVHVTFEWSINGGASYAMAGSGARIAGGWEINGAALPAAGLLRARAFTAGGAAGGLVESVQSYAGLPVPNFVVTGNGVAIPSGDATPSLTDHTDFGGIPVGRPPVVRTFTIANTGTAALNPGMVTIGGPDAASFSVTQQPATTVASGGTTTLLVRFTPGSDPGLRSAILIIPNNGSNETPFVFSIQGTVLLSDIADLSSLQISPGILTPVFAGNVTAYSAGIAYADSSVTVQCGTVESSASVALQINGGSFLPLAANTPSPAQSMLVGANTVTLRVTAADGTIVIYNVIVTRRAMAAGDLDPLNIQVGGGSVLDTVVCEDGAILIAGDFLVVQGVLRRNLARLNPDGSLDTQFNPSPDGTVHAVALLDNGDILIGGEFTSVLNLGHAEPANYFARLNDSGNPAGPDLRLNDAVYCIAVTSDDSVIVGGRFTEIWPDGDAAPSARIGIAMVDASARIARSFHPDISGGVSAHVSSLALQPNGQLLFGGDFAFVQTGAGAPVARRNLVRVSTSTGALDSGFDPSPNGVVRCLGVQPDGRILTGGEFTALQPNGGSVIQRGRFARLESDGTVDSSFTPAANAPVTRMALQVDGRILLCGDFSLMRPSPGVGTGIDRSGVARVNASGTLDTGFDPRVDGGVSCMTLHADGRILLGGAFTGLMPNESSGPAGRSGFARLVNDPATSVLTVPDNSRIRWLRGGSAPEALSVRFERSANGSTAFNSLGTVQRISGGWERTGLNLPSSGYIRATGMVDVRLQGDGGGDARELVSYSGFVPEIAVSGNGMDIASGDTSPSLPDSTGFGTLAPGAAPVVHTFTLTNTGTSRLLPGTVTVSGTGAASFVITQQPAVTVLPGSFTTFSITFSASSPGLRTATVSIPNNDADENPFTFSVEGSGLSTPPVISDLADLVISEDSASGALAVTVSDVETPAAELVLTAASSNALLVPEAGIVIGGSGSNRSVTLTPAAGMNGAAVITLTVTDGQGLTAVDTFQLTVSAVNDAPFFTPGENRSHVPATVSPQTVPGWATGISDGDPEVAQALTFSVSTDLPGLFTAAPAIDAAGTLTYTLSGIAGTATVSVSLADDATAGGPALQTAVQTFTITAASVADYILTTTAGQMVITDANGNGDVLGITAPVGGSIRFAATGRTFRVNGGANITGSSGNVSLAGITSIIVNAGAGTDTISVGAFTGSFPALTVNGGTGDDAITFAGDLTFAANASLDVDLQNDDAAPGGDAVTFATNANVLLAGTGTATVRCSRNVVLNTGSSLEVVHGSLTMEANRQAVATAADFTGLSVSGVIQSTGTGSVTVLATGGSGTTACRGIYLLASGSIRGGTSGLLTVEGVGGLSTGGSNRGLQMDGTIGSAGASVDVTGTGGGTGAATSSNNGVLIFDGSSISAGGGGTVTVQGTGGVGTSSSGVTLQGAGALITSGGGDVVVRGSGTPPLNFTLGAAVVTPAAGGDITLIGDSINVDSTSSISALGGDRVSLTPLTAGLAINLGTSAPGLTLTDAALDRFTAGTVQIGGATSGPVTVRSLISPANYRTLALGNHTTFTASGGFTADIGPTASDYEKIIVTGTVNLTAGAQLNLAATGGFVPANGQTFTLLTNDGSDTITGIFTGKPEGATLASFLGSGLAAKFTYLGGTGNDVVVSLGNLPPAAPPQTFARAQGQPLTIDVAVILAACSDPNPGTTLVLLSTGPSTSGASVVRSGNQLIYTPVNNNDDSFTYTIGDGSGPGGTATNTITIRAVPVEGKPVGVSTSPTGEVTTEFIGVPGETYTIECSADLTGWCDLVTLEAQADGRVVHTGTGSGSREFFRLKQK